MLILTRNTQNICNCCNVTFKLCITMSIWTEATDSWALEQKWRKINGTQILFYEEWLVLFIGLLTGSRNVDDERVKKQTFFSECEERKAKKSVTVSEGKRKKTKGLYRGKQHRKSESKAINTGNQICWEYIFFFLSYSLTFFCICGWTWLTQLINTQPLMAD